MLLSPGSRHPAWQAIALLVVSAWPASAQGRPFDDLGRYLRNGDTVFVVERTEGASEGTVTSVSPAVIVVSVSGQERAFTKDSVAWIERSPDPVWEGAALGATMGLPMGLLGTAFGSGGALPLFIGGGAAIGAAADAAIRGRQLVYGRMPRRLFMRRPVPVSSLGDLWSRVAPGETVRIRDASVGERTGRFVKASPEAVTIDVDLGRVIIPAARVQLVERRGYVPGHWLGIGMVLGGVAGYFKKHDEYNRHATREDTGAGVLLGGFAALVATGKHARYTDIYRAETTAAHDIVMGPVVERGRRGVAVTVRF
jgi:hypothetical protein